MADVSPFLSTPQQWVEKLGLLRAERQKLEAQEERLRDKLRLHMTEKSLSSVEGDAFTARLERRESTDFSQSALSTLFGNDWLREAKAALPVKISESLVIRERRNAEEIKDAMIERMDKK